MFTRVHPETGKESHAVLAGTAVVVSDPPRTPTITAYRHLLDSGALASQDTTGYMSASI